MNRAIYLTLALFLSAAAVRAENWPSWRGPHNDGISNETKLPLEWAADKNVVWKFPMPGRGGATPVVWGDRIFVTSGEGQDQVLLCLSTAGKQLWKKKVGTGGRATIKGDEANEASASPSTDGKHVYVFVGTGNLACYDFDGNEKWNVNLQEKYGKFQIQHGLHTSPLLHEDKLYVVMLHGKGQLVLAFDKATGQEKWRIDRPSDSEGESKESYASPILWNDGKELQVVALGSDYATGHRLKDGSEVWRLGDLNPKAKYSTALRIIATPVAAKDMLLVPTARGGIFVALKPGAKGFIKADSSMERWRRPKGCPDVPSVVVHDGLVYACRENGVLQVWQAKTGEEIHNERLHVDRYRASPVYADGRVYVISRDGTAAVVKAGGKFEVLATNVLPDVFTASPAISNGRIYLRGFDNLYAIGEK